LRQGFLYQLPITVPATFMGCDPSLAGINCIEGNGPIGCLSSTADSSPPVTIRPERFALDEAGEMFRITVLLDNGDVLTVKQQNRGQAGVYQRGIRVKSGWSPGDMMVLDGRFASSSVASGGA
jgi:hypothetical protein